MKVDNNILTILTKDDQKEIKQALKNIIIEQIKSDFESQDEYIFDRDSIDELMEEAMDEIKEEIKPLLKDFLFSEMEKKLGIKQKGGK